MISKLTQEALAALKTEIAQAKAAREARRDARPHDVDHSHEMHFLIAKHINRVRKERGYSMAELARRIGIDKAQLTRWLTGRQNLTVKSIARMQAALGEPVVMVSDQAYKSFEERGLRGTPGSWIEEESSDRMMFFQPTSQRGTTFIKWRTQTVHPIQHQRKSTPAATLALAGA